MTEQNLPELLPWFHIHRGDKRDKVPKHLMALNDWARAHVLSGDPAEELEVHMYQISEPGVLSQLCIHKGNAATLLAYAIDNAVDKRHVKQMLAAAHEEIFTRAKAPAMISLGIVDDDVVTLLDLAAPPTETQLEQLANAAEWLRDQIEMLKTRKQGDQT